MDYLLKNDISNSAKGIPIAIIFRPFRAEIGSPERAKYVEE